MEEKLNKLKEKADKLRDTMDKNERGATDKMRVRPWIDERDDG